MLPKQAQDWLKANKIDIDALVKAHTSEDETEVTLPTGKVLTDEQLAERDSNVKLAAIKEGEDKAIEIAKSELKKKGGFDIAGNRWGDIVNELNDKINIDKDTKVKQLQEQNSLLLKDNEKYKVEATEAVSRIGKAEFEFGVLASLPKNDLGLNPKETLAVLQMRGFEPVKGDKGVVWNKNGEAIKDGATHAPMAETDAVKHIWGELGWKTEQAPAGGRNIGGTGATGTGGIATMADAKKAFKAANPNTSIVSPEFETFVDAAAKSNPAFDYSVVS
jgi:predicted aspartyl protease